MNAQVVQARRGPQVSREQVRQRSAEWDIVEALVRQAQAGDRDAFGELVERFQGSVHAVVRRRQRDADEAAEIVQEVFIHAMVKIAQLREPAAFGAWLRQIAVRVTINRGTRRPPLATAEAEILELGGAPRGDDRHADSPLENLLGAERRQQVRDAVNALRPMDRQALEAFYLHGKPLAQIAEELDVPLGTIKRRLHVARNRLQEVLESADAGASRPTPAAADAPAAARVADAKLVTA